MCGIVGAMSMHMGNTEKERFKELLTVSNLRGYQGAGAIITDNQGNVNTFKTTDTGTHLAHDPAFNERLYHSKPYRGVSTLIGHTRWPTKGAVTLEATHPHEHDGIVGVHNGTIEAINGKWIGKDESDSSLLYKSFAENGVIETIRETQGAYALVWIDQRRKTLNFLRNEKRPLYLAVMAGQGTIYWASERGMLDFVLGRQVGKFEVLNLLPNKWSEYDFPLRNTINNNNLTEVHGKAAPAVAAGHAPFQRMWTTTSTGGATGGATRTSTNPEVIAETKKGGEEKGSTGSGNVTPSGDRTVIPMLPRPGTTSTWMPTGADKPKRAWDDQKLEWVLTQDEPAATTLILPHSSTPKTETTTSPGGSQTKKPSATQERKESQSTEGNFRNDVLRHDGQMGGSGEDESLVPERDFSQGPQNISEVMQELFNDSKTLYPGYRMTLEDNWMSEEHYLKILGDGCLWCGDAQPDVPSNLWTDTDEFMCEVCQGDQFARDYICLQLGLQPEELAVPLLKSA